MLIVAVFDLAKVKSCLTYPEQIKLHLTQTCNSHIKRNPVFLLDFSINRLAGWLKWDNQMILPLLDIIKLNYRSSVESDLKTNSSTSFITFRSLISFLGLFEHFLQHCTPSWTSSTDFFQRGCHANVKHPNLTSPSLCLVNTILIYHRGPSDTFPFPLLVWSCQHPLAAVCIPTLWDNAGSFL